MANLPVVAIVATHGEERIPLLLDRALPSILRQTRAVDLILVVSDDDVLMDDDSVVKEILTPDLCNRLPLKLLSNRRTRGASGTGR